MGECDVHMFDFLLQFLQCLLLVLLLVLFAARERGRVTFHLEHVLAFSSHSCVSGGDDPLEDKLTGLLSFTLS